MQHVDEGRLHAWLDGELPPAGPEGARALERHLEECAACRARADEERRIRDDASSILRRADPVEQPPPGVIPFPAPAPARRPARPWVALGWAASVLLALGIGWMARPEPEAPVAINAPPAPTADAVDAEAAAPATTDLHSAPTATGVTRTPAAPAPRADRTAARTVPPVGVVVPSAAPAAPPPVPMAEAPPAALPPPPPPPPALAAAAAPPVASPAAASARAEEASADRAPRMSTLRGRVTDTRGLGVPGALVAVPSLAARTTTRADGSYTLSVPASEDTVQVVATQIGLEGQARSLVAEPEASKTVDFALAPSAVALEGVVVTGQARAARGRAAVSAPTAPPPPAAWRSVDRAEAERRLGRPLVIVPNLPLLGVELGAAEGRATVRATQRLPDGAVLSLVQWRGSGARPPRPCDAPASGAACITFTRSGVLVQASAPVPAEALRAHLAPLF